MNTNRAFFDLTEQPLVMACLLALILLVYMPTVLAGPEGRTRTFCSNIFYSETRACGGHLEPACTSGSACDAGINTYSGSPFPITINCPSPIADETISLGCYDNIPSCADCSGPGQVPCPVEAAAYCTVGCDEGLTSNPTTTLCEAPGTPGSPCGPGYPCGPGLSCDPTSFQCVAPAQAGESCANPFVSCADGLQCTLALECAHEPARLGETCDVTAPCGEGLFCQPGVPQRCHALRKPGEGCSIVNPCIEGASCEACLVDGCNAPLQCFWDANNGAISEQQCRTLYSPALHNGAKDIGGAMTYGGGNEAAAIVGESQEFGVAYGIYDDEYGCYTTLCGGINADISIEHFASVGLYLTFDDVGGSSFANVQEAQLPGNLLNFSTAQIYARDPGAIIPNPVLIGTADAFSVGIGPNILPFSAGSLLCETVLDPLDPDPGPGTTPGSGSESEYIPPPPFLTSMGYGSLDFDGSNDKLVLSDPVALSAFEMSDAMTLEAWIRPDQASQDLTVLSKEGEYQLGLLNGELAFSIANDSPGWFWTRTGYFPPIYLWTHIALVYGDIDGVSEQRVYVNGELAHRSAAYGLIGDRHPENREFHIGGRERYSATYSGLIDEVRVWSRVLSAEEIRAGLNQPPDTSDVQLVATWDFQESDGNTVYDAGTGGYDLALDGQGVDATPQRQAENRLQEGVALYFDGVDDHVAVLAEDALPGLEVEETLTLEAWVYPAGEGSGIYGGTIINKEGEYYLGRATDGRVTYALANSNPGWVTVTSNVIVPERRWSHLALVFDNGAGQVTLYLNGAPAETLVAEGSIGDAHPNSQQLRIGGRERDDNGGEGQRFHGAIDEARVWNIARSAAEISQSYTAMVNSDSAGLVGYWRFDEAGLNIAFDQTAGHGNGLLGSGRNWESPVRVNARALLGYPSTLIDPCAGSSATDSDGDGICDAVDNCPVIANGDQADANSDGTGDACTVTFTDADNDGVLLEDDQCPNTPALEPVDANGCSASQLSSTSSSSGGGGSLNPLLLLLMLLIASVAIFRPQKPQQNKLINY